VDIYQPCLPQASSGLAGVVPSASVVAMWNLHHVSPGKEVTVLRNQGSTHWGSRSLNGRVVLDVAPTWPGIKKRVPALDEDPGVASPFKPAVSAQHLMPSHLRVGLERPEQSPQLEFLPSAMPTQQVLINYPKERIKPSRRILAQSHGATHWNPPSTAGFASGQGRGFQIPLGHGPLMRAHDAWAQHVAKVEAHLEHAYNVCGDYGHEGRDISYVRHF